MTTVPLTAEAQRIGLDSWAHLLGVAPFVIAPDQWASSSELDENERCVTHEHTFAQSSFHVTLSHLISAKQDAGVDVLVSWSDSDEASGMPMSEMFSVQIGTIPALISALQHALNLAGAAR